MNLKQIYSAEKLQEQGFFTQKFPVISFEIFPPKDDEDGEKTKKLYSEVEKLKTFNPALISLTYGAGGSNRNLSLDIIKHLKTDDKINVMPHFTCVCSKKSDISEHLKTIEGLGIENILALRGDAPENVDVCHLDFRHANELVSYIKSETDLSIGVAGYPEGHIEAPDIFTDIDYLKKKVDAGADAIYTQLFFDNDKFFSFVQLVRDAGIKTPIIVGILPIISYAQLEKMLNLARVTVPKALLERLERVKDNPEDVKKIGIEFASYQCNQLIDAEVAGLHFYTLNKAHSTTEILTNLGV